MTVKTAKTGIKRPSPVNEEGFWPFFGRHDINQQRCVIIRNGINGTINQKMCVKSLHKLAFMARMVILVYSLAFRKPVGAPRLATVNSVLHIIWYSQNVPRVHSKLNAKDPLKRK